MYFPEFKIKLNREKIHIHNKVLAPWLNMSSHALKIERPDGVTVNYKGITLSGTAHRVFWKTVNVFVEEFIITTIKELSSGIRDCGIHPEKELTLWSNCLKDYIEYIIDDACDIEARCLGDGIIIPTKSDQEERIKKLKDFLKIHIDGAKRRERGVFRKEWRLRWTPNIIAIIGVAAAITFGVYQVTSSPPPPVSPPIINNYITVP